MVPGEVQAPPEEPEVEPVEGGEAAAAAGDAATEGAAAAGAATDGAAGTGAATDGAAAAGEAAEGAAEAPREEAPLGEAA